MLKIPTIDLRILRAIILDNRHMLFFMLVLRFWYFCFKDRRNFIECFFDHQRKPLCRILKEVFSSWRYWGMFPFEYFMCKLYKQHPERSLEEIIDYVPQYYLDHVHSPQKNDRVYKLNLENKIMLDKLLAGRSIPRPRTVITVEGGEILDERGNRIDAKGLPDVLVACNGALFVKPADGRGGTGIEVFEQTGCGVFKNKLERRFDYDYLADIGKKNDYIIQEGIEQIDELSNVFPYSINTIRIASVVENGKVRPIAAILRIGRGANRVDNSAQGGISVEVSIDTWSLMTRGHSEHPVASYEIHPDTKASFGFQLPMKQQVLDLINKAALIIPKCHILGWDIALTPQGPVIIEINPGFGINHVQITCQRGVRKDLGISL